MNFLRRFCPDLMSPCRSAARPLAFYSALLATLAALSAEAATTTLLSRLLGGSAAETAWDCAVDAEGNIYLAGDTRSPYLATAGVLQRFYAGGSAASGGDAFVAKLSPEGRVLFFTYLGGTGNDGASAIALGPDGSIYVTGVTDSPDFPTRNAARRFISGVPSPYYLPIYPYDVFVARIAPDGSRLIYSTYLGGSFADQSTGIAVDQDGSAYVTGFTESSDFPRRAGLNSTNMAGSDAFLTKVAPDGRSFMHSSLLGGAGRDSAEGLALDGQGRVFLTGFTTSSGFPVTPDAFQPVLGGGRDAFLTVVDAAGTSLEYSTFLGGVGNDVGFRVALDGSGNPHVCGMYSGEGFPLTPGVELGGMFRSQDAASSWSLSSAGLYANNILSLAVDPSNPAVVYAGTWRGISRSADGGQSWEPVLQRIKAFRTVAVDPLNPSVVYAGDTQVWKSTNGGSSWALSSKGLSTRAVYALAAHPQSPGTVFAGTSIGVFVTTNAAQSWKYAIGGMGLRPVYDLVFDPSDAERIYAAAGGGVYYSLNRGSRWTPLNRGLSGVNGIGLAVNPADPSRLYLASQKGLYRFDAATNSWVAVPLVSGTNLLAAKPSLADVVLDSANPSIIYAGGPAGMFRSLDAGQNWEWATNGFGSIYINQLAAVPGAPNTVLAAIYAQSFAQTGSGNDAFLVKFAGGNPQFSTGIGGSGNDQAWDLDLDGAGNIYLTGLSSSRNHFPTNAPETALRDRRRGNFDAFVTALTPDGASCLYSGFLGGKAQEYGYAIEVDAAGTATVVGGTSSGNFPGLSPPNRLQGPSDAFIYRIAPANGIP